MIKYHVEVREKSGYNEPPTHYKTVYTGKSQKEAVAEAKYYAEKNHQVQIHVTNELAS